MRKWSSCTRRSFSDGSAKVWKRTICDVGGQEPERVYHAFVPGLLVGLNKTHKVKSNREGRLGRYDARLIPRNTGERGVIIEFKKVNPYTGETLEEAAGRALEQIARKNWPNAVCAKSFASASYFRART